VMKVAWKDVLSVDLSAICSVGRMVDYLDTKRVALMGILWAVD